MKHNAVLTSLFRTRAVHASIKGILPLYKYMYTVHQLMSRDPEDFI